MADLGAVSELLTAQLMVNHQSDLARANITATHQQGLANGLTGVATGRLMRDFAEQDVAESTSIKTLLGDPGADAITRTLAALNAGSIAAKGTVLTPPVHPQPGVGKSPDG